jgi:hypothetical protein
MKNFFTLEYKELDSKGREKNQKYVGVFKDINSLEFKKNELLQSLNNNISFYVYSHQSIF